MSLKSSKLNRLESRSKLLDRLSEILNNVCNDDEEFRKFVVKIGAVFDKVKGKESPIFTSEIARLLGEICAKKRIIRHEKYMSAIEFAAKLVLMLLDEDDERRTDQKSSRSG